jgi:glucan phosphoethanolaminetransferase (alkaline phosphatase superfamily)
MAIAKKLEKASGLLFFAGFFLSKFQYVPFMELSAIFRFVSLGMYLLAYGLWFTANLLHPDHKVHQNKWYGFAQIKEQFLFSSFIGLVATLLSVAAIALPVLLPPAAILFLIGNVLWTIGEYHKLKNPLHNDPQFSHTRQRDYLSYAMTTTTISLISAIAAILIFAFPPITIPVTIFSVLLCVGLGVFAFEFYLKSNFGEHKTTPVTNSYNQMTEDLGPSLAPKPNIAPAPSFCNCFSWSETPTEDEEIELVNFAAANESSEDRGFRFNSSL